LRNGERKPSRKMGTKKEISWEKNAKKGKQDTTPGKGKEKKITGKKLDIKAVKIRERTASIRTGKNKNRGGRKGDGQTWGKGEEKKNELGKMGDMGLGKKEEEPKNFGRMEGQKSTFQIFLPSLPFTQTLPFPPSLDTRKPPPLPTHRSPHPPPPALPEKKKALKRGGLTSRVGWGGLSPEDWKKTKSNKGNKKKERREKKRRSQYNAPWCGVNIKGERTRPENGGDDEKEKKTFPTKIKKAWVKSGRKEWKRQKKTGKKRLNLWGW